MISPQVKMACTLRWEVPSKYKMSLIAIGKNLSRRKFGASVILLAISNITALALLDSHFWSKAFAVIIVDAIWLKIAYDDTIMQSIGIAIGFYSFVSVWDVLVLLAVSFLSKKAFSTYMENPMEYYLICYGVKCLELLLTVIIGLFEKILQNKRL